MATTIPSEENVVGMPKARKVVKTCRWRGVLGLHLLNQTLSVFQDSGLLEDVESERL